MNGDNLIFFDSFRVECIPKEIKKFISNRNIKTSIYRTQANDKTMCERFCIGFIAFILKCKHLLDYTNLFFPKEDEKNDYISIKYFQ